MEADEHPYEVVYEKLPKQLGFEPQVTLEEEVYEMLKLLTQPHIRERIEAIRRVILPKTRWSGLHKEMEVLERYKVKPRKKVSLGSDGGGEDDTKRE